MITDTSATIEEGIIVIHHPRSLEHASRSSFRSTHRTGRRSRLTEPSRIKSDLSTDVNQFAHNNNAPHERGRATCVWRDRVGESKRDHVCRNDDEDDDSLVVRRASWFARSVTAGSSVLFAAISTQPIRSDRFRVCQLLRP